jgi:hypothetical protein
MKIRYKRSSIPLTIELIPKSCQGHSLYHNWPTKWWDKLRKLVYSRAGRKCEICGGGPKIECHEVWEFNLETRTQKLLYLVCLCHNCHQAKHFGRAYLTNNGREAIKHLMKVNHWTLERTLFYIDLVYKRHEKYQGIIFKKKLNLNILDDFIAKFQIKDRKTSKPKKKKRKAKTIKSYKKVFKRRNKR